MLIRCSRAMVNNARSTILRCFSSSSLSFRTEDNPRVGWIGCGVMGVPMCLHLMEKGYKNMSVFNRTASKADSLVAKGAVLCDTPLQVAQNSDIVFSIVGFPDDVRDVVLHPETGVLAGLQPNGVFVDMTTTSPSLSLEIAKRGEEIGVMALDAPVSGGDVGARNATLSIMVGGERKAFDAVLPMFQAMGTSVNWMGGSSKGSHTKMVNQILIATTMIGVSEGLIYAHKAGLNLNEAIQAVSGGAAGSFSISNYGPRIVSRDFEPGFMVDHFIKDLGIALREAEKFRLCLPGLALAQQLYLSVKALGLEHKGTHALQLALERMNNITDMGSQPESKV